MGLVRTALPILAVLVGIATAAAESASAPVAIVVGPEASSVERVAAKDLATCLRQLYPRQAFDVRTELPQSGRRILVGTVTTNPWLAAASYIDRQQISTPESFLVAVAPGNSRETAVDRRGRSAGMRLSACTPSWRNSAAASICPTMPCRSRSRRRFPSTAGSFPTGRWRSIESCSTGTIS